MSRRREPEWRNRAAADLLIRNLPRLEISGPVLVVEDPASGVLGALASLGLEATAWNRRVFGGRGGAPWPPDGPFQTVALRLPRDKDELAMGLHAAASVLRPGGWIFVYGANDEGIQAALPILEGSFSDTTTLAVGGRCRVLGGVRGPEVPGLRGSLREWRSVLRLEHDDLPPSWVSYPGIFAHGRLDSGTRLLMEALPPLGQGSRVLDYGCGSGVVGYVARSRGEDVAVELLDVDAVALEASRENVPGCRLHLRDGLPPVGVGSFDAILSNPPFHRGKAEDPEMITSLVRGAPALLGLKGILVFVAQRRLPVDSALDRSFRRVAVLAEDGTFRVWKGESPRRGKGLE